MCVCVCVCVSVRVFFFFFFFVNLFQKIELIIHANYLPRRQFAFNIKLYFLANKKISICRLLNLFKGVYGLHKS